MRQSSLLVIHSGSYLEVFCKSTSDLSLYETILPSKHNAPEYWNALELTLVLFVVWIRATFVGPRDREPSDAGLRENRRDFWVLRIRGKEEEKYKHRSVNLPIEESAYLEERQQFLSLVIHLETVEVHEVARNAHDAGVEVLERADVAVSMPRWLMRAENAVNDFAFRHWRKSHSFVLLDVLF